MEYNDAWADASIAVRVMVMVEGVSSHHRDVYRVIAEALATSDLIARSCPDSRKGGERVM